MIGSLLFIEMRGQRPEQQDAMDLVVGREAIQGLIEFWLGCLIAQRDHRHLTMGGFKPPNGSLPIPAIRRVIPHLDDGELWGHPSVCKSLHADRQGAHQRISHRLTFKLNHGGVLSRQGPWRFEPHRLLACVAGRAAG